LAGKLQKAGAHANVHSAGVAEVTEVRVFGLPPNTDFDFFLIQKPVAKFGLSWYQGDIETDGQGNGFALFIGASTLRHLSSHRVRKRLPWSLTKPSMIAE
jgi:hypothetical protein